MSAVCATPGCDRAPVPVSASGIKHSLCADCEREALSCFGETWHVQARAGVLRPAITGGLPIDTPTEGARGQKPMGVPATQRADALAGGSSASDPAASGRAIAQATPGPTHSSHPDLPVEVGREGIPRSSVSHLDRGAALATQPA